jgi:predicted nucleotidyltransferase component of viral defense system
MLEFSQIRDQYSVQLHGFERSLLREYLQFKILKGIFESRHASKISFLGGTALRIIYGNNRFSEDIDLDNFGLNWAEFKKVVDATKDFLELDGFEVELSYVEKGVYHCDIRFPNILFENGISPIRNERILIRIDSAAQGYDYEPEIKLLNKFDVFTQVRVTPPAILLSQKIYTATNRRRPKGRDFYDITFLLGQTKPDYGFLEEKFGVDSPEALRSIVFGKIRAYDFKALAEDVGPFLIRKTEHQRVAFFKEFWKQTELI